MLSCASSANGDPLRKSAFLRESSIEAAGRVSMAWTIPHAHAAVRFHLKRF
ncbi:MAG: hypothetical protein ACUVYA_15330 [Planctomycetota bacterium]